MKGLKSLQRENERLRKAQQKIQEMDKLNRERMRLMKENKALMFRTKHKGLVQFSDRATHAIGRLGVGTFKALQKWGDKLNEAERRQRRINTKLKRTVRRR